MSFELHAPGAITIGQPISFEFSSSTRVSGRVRLTAGPEALPFRLIKAGAERSDRATGHRVRGKTGAYQIVDWGVHEAGTELVLRFEGRKIWMTVRDGD